MITKALKWDPTLLEKNENIKLNLKNRTQIKHRKIYRVQTIEKKKKSSTKNLSNFQKYDQKFLEKDKAKKAVKPQKRKENQEKGKK